MNTRSLNKLLIIVLLLLAACNPSERSSDSSGAGNNFIVLGQPSYLDIECYDQSQNFELTCAHVAAANMIEYHTGRNVYAELVDQFPPGEYYIGELLRWYFGKEGIEIEVDFEQKPEHFQTMLSGIEWDLECAAILIEIADKNHYITTWRYDPEEEIIYFTNGTDRTKGLLWEYTENFNIIQIVSLAMQ